MLDAVALSTGRRFVRWPDGTCKLVTASDSESQHDENLDAGPWDKIAGGDIGLWQVPATVRVCFPRLSDHIPRPHLIYTVDKDATGDGTPVADTVHVIHAAAWARRSDADTSTPTNSSWLSALAEKIRDDYYAWLDGAYDYTYQGHKPWKPSGYDDHVLYTFTRQAEDKPTAGGTLQGDGRTVPVLIRKNYTYESTTRIVSMPPNACAVQNLAQDEDNVVLRGVQMAYSTAEITRAAPAAARVIVHDLTIANEYKALRDFDNEYVTITVGAYSLNTTESIDAATAIYVQGFPLSGRWEPTGGNCAVRDWQTPDEESAEEMAWQGIIDGAIAAASQNRPRIPPDDANGVLLQ